MPDALKVVPTRKWEVRHCLVCDKEIDKKTHESVARYGTKKFCSQICSKQYMKANKIGWFSNDKIAKQFPPYKELHPDYADFEDSVR